MPEKTKRIFISDVHIGEKRAVQPGRHYYDWQSEDEADAFAGFLKYLNRPASTRDVKEIVLLGDIFDNWVYPVDEIPPTIEEVITAGKNRPIMDQLKALAGSPRVEVRYMRGNHDMDTTKRVIEKYFPGMRFGGTDGSILRDGCLRAEHGHALGIFNMPFIDRNGKRHPPIGYFITRILATIEARTGKVPPHGLEWLKNGIDDLIKAASPGHTFAEALMNVILDEYKRMTGLSRNVRIRMPQKYQKQHAEDFITAKEIKKRYAGLIRQWKKRHPRKSILDGIHADITFTENVADSLFSKDDKLIINGHSHKRKVLSGNLPERGHIDDPSNEDIYRPEEITAYANCGTWCDRGKPLTFIVTEKIKARKEYRVELRRWVWDKGAGRGKVAKSSYVKGAVYF